MVKLVHPTINDVDRLKEMWVYLFPEDADGYCDFFFERYFTPDKCYMIVNEADNEIESLMYAVDEYYKSSDGRLYKFGYMYAGGTKKKYRGHDNIRRALRDCRSMMAEHGYYGMTYASAEHLISMYDVLGDKHFPPMYECVLEREAPSDIVWEKCSADRFERLRDEFIDSVGTGFRWCGATQQFIYDDICSCGDVLVCMYGGKEYFAVCLTDNDDLTVAETSFPITGSDILAHSLRSWYGHKGSTTLLSHTPVDNGQCRAVYNGHYAVIREFPGCEEVENAYKKFLTI